MIHSRKFVITFGIISMFICCKAKHVLVYHLVREYISLNFLDSVHYRYLYYNLTDTSFAYEFNTGKYVRRGKYYTLFPDSIDNEHYDVQYQVKTRKELDHKLRIHVVTDIAANNLGSYEIEMKTSDDRSMIFRNFTADTIILKNQIKSLKIMIHLIGNYSKGMGNQHPAFTTVTTKGIILDTMVNLVNIHVPVTFSTFFYKYERKIELEAVGVKWKVDGRLIQMRNVDF